MRTDCRKEDQADCNGRQTREFGPGICMYGGQYLIHKEYWQPMEWGILKAMKTEGVRHQKFKTILYSQRKPLDESSFLYGVGSNPALMGSCHQCAASEVFQAFTRERRLYASFVASHIWPVIFQYKAQERFLVGRKLSSQSRQNRLLTSSPAVYITV